MANRHVTRDLTDIGAVSTTPAIYVGDLDSAAVGVFGSFTATAQVQESPDGTNWFTIGANFTDDAYREVTSDAQYVRVNVLGYTSGTVEATVGGQQRSAFDQTEVNTDTLTTTGAGHVEHVAHLTSARVWALLPAGVSAAIHPQYSHDGSDWINISAGTSVTSSWAVPDNALQSRVLVSILGSSSILCATTGRKIRAGSYITTDMGSLSATGSTSPVDCSKFQNATVWYTGTFGASVEVHVSPDGTNFYSIGTISDASGTVTLPAWALQAKMVATSYASGAVVGTITENTALRADARP